MNPPVHAWAVWQVYKTADPKGQRDVEFWKGVSKLLLNFTWWVNRKDVEGRHVFGGGFLRLDNIGVFDRSRPLPGGGRLNQADGTAMDGVLLPVDAHDFHRLARGIGLLMKTSPSKFFEHFVNITDAINALGGNGLWDEEDGFYYDQLLLIHQPPIPLKVRSLVGLLPMMRGRLETGND